jgi:hypothetical protein
MCPARHVRAAGERLDVPAGNRAYSAVGSGLLSPADSRAERSAQVLAAHWVLRAFLGVGLPARSCNGRFGSTHQRVSGCTAVIQVRVASACYSVVLMLIANPVPLSGLERISVSGRSVSPQAGGYAAHAGPVRGRHVCASHWAADNWSARHGALDALTVSRHVAEAAGFSHNSRHPLLFVDTNGGPLACSTFRAGRGSIASCSPVRTKLSRPRRRCSAPASSRCTAPSMRPPAPGRTEWRPL